MFDVWCLWWLQIDFLNKHLFLTSKPVIYLVNLSEKDYIRKKNKWYVSVGGCGFLVGGILLGENSLLTQNWWWYDGLTTSISLALLFASCCGLSFLSLLYSLFLSFLWYFPSPSVHPLLSVCVGWTLGTLHLFLLTITLYLFVLTMCFSFPFASFCLSTLFCLFIGSFCFPLYAYPLPHLFFLLCDLSVHC